MKSSVVAITFLSATRQNLVFSQPVNSTMATYGKFCVGALTSSSISHVILFGVWVNFTAKTGGLF